MQKIMFNDKFGLTKAVLEGKKSQTRRIALHSKEDVQVLDELNLTPEDRSIRQYVIDKYSRFKVEETVAVAQSYETIHRGMENRPAEDFYYPTIHIKNIDNLVKTARSTKIADILKLQDHSEIILDKAKKSERVTAKTHPELFLNQIKPFALQNFIQEFSGNPGWNNKMFVKADFMPYQIRITDIRLERLQDISDDDCLAEGVTRWTDEKEYDCDESVRKSIDEIEAAGYETFAIPGCWDCFTSPRQAYAALIDKVSGKGTWDKNPWVFVYDFELIKQ